jgi:hypothetical protein
MITNHDVEKSEEIGARLWTAERRSLISSRIFGEKHYQKIIVIFYEKKYKKMKCR